MRFKDFVETHDGKGGSTRKTQEELFEEVTGVNIPSMDSFVAWLTLHKHIKPYVKENGKPIPVMKLSENKKILYLVKKLPTIKELAKEFGSKFGKSEYLRD